MPLGTNFLDAFPHRVSMEELCCIAEDDPGTLGERLDVFVSDRSVGSLTGPRRFGRDNLVEAVAEKLRSNGVKVSLIPGSSIESPEVIMFRHWKDIDEEMVGCNPGADVLYGQDLCHQVPAVVRVIKESR